MPNGDHVTLDKEYISIRIEEYETIPRPDGEADPKGVRGSSVLHDLVDAFPYLRGRIRPLVTSLDRKELQELWQRARDMDPTYSVPPLETWYAVAPKKDGDKVKVLAHLQQDDRVLSLDVVRAGPDPCSNPEGNPLFASQTHLEPAEHGTGAAKAWANTGADGTGVAFADVEQGWTTDHDDLADHNIPAPLSGTVRNASRAHGTQVLGVVCAVNNDLAGIGVAPKLDAVYVASRHESTVADAVSAATTKLGAGDVLLLEVQDEEVETGRLVPVELDPGTWTYVRTATALQISVIEVAGNGDEWNTGVDLDEFPALRRGAAVFQPLRGRLGKRLRLRLRRAEVFKDSYAVMVAAGQRVTRCGVEDWYRLPSSNHGSRIDCFAHGEDVPSCSSDDEGSTTACSKSLSMTSAAAAVVAGAAVAVQGMARHIDGAPLSPKDLRSILSDPEIGTLPSPYEPKQIGAMPDLVAIHEDLTALQGSVIEAYESPPATISWRASNLHGQAHAFTVRVLESEVSQDEEFILEDESILPSAFRADSSWVPAHTPKRYVEAKAGDARCCLEAEDEFARIEVRLSAAGVLTIELRDAGFGLVGSATGDANCPGGPDE